MRKFFSIFYFFGEYKHKTVYFAIYACAESLYKQVLEKQCIAPLNKNSIYLVYQSHAFLLSIHVCN